MINPMIIFKTLDKKPILFSLIAAMFLTEVAMGRADTEHNMVKEIPAYDIWPAKGASYSQHTPYDDNYQHFIIVDRKGRKKDQPEKWQIKPILAQNIAPISVILQNEKASAAINGGYFNLNDGVSASYVIIDGKEMANPRTNKALVKNSKLKPYLEKIFNRSEIRVLQDDNGNTCYDIARHNDPIAKNYKLIHSLQAGPQLLPKLTLQEEAFIRRNSDNDVVDAINAFKKTARTAFGITKEGNLVLFVASGKGQNPESAGLTLDELCSAMQSQGCVKAINLDGDASTTMFVRPMPAENSANIPQGVVICGKHPEARVKSVLGLYYQ